MRHKVDEREATTSLLIEKTNGDRIWSDEATIHKHDEASVLSYWAKHNGRFAATGLEEYHVLRILAHHPPSSKPSTGQYKVQWVGYSSAAEETTWEVKSKVRKISPAAVEAYEKGRVRIREAVKEIAAAKKVKVVGKAVAKPVVKLVKAAKRA